AGGTVSNTGTGIILGSSGYAAITIGKPGYGGVGVIINQATIAGGAGVRYAGVGTLGQTIIDSGTIIGNGGTAVGFAAGDDLVKFVPGNVFVQGTVSGGGGADTL